MAHGNANGMRAAGETPARADPRVAGAMQVNKAATFAIPADPNDPEDSDVSAAGR